MSLSYGVLRGKIDIFKREDDSNTPHLQIRVIDGLGKPWRVPVNVLSQDSSFLVFHRADPLQNHPILEGLDQISQGYTELPQTVRTPATALDYFRAPLFVWSEGIAIPHSGPRGDDDLQDTLTTYLQQLKTQVGELFAFGTKFPNTGQPFSARSIDREFNTRQGIHNIHMNQGSTRPGSYARDNGVYQDGGLILKFPGRVVALMMRFQNQRLPTDDATGHPLRNAQPIPPGSAPLEIVEEQPPRPTEPPVPLFPDVYIERALVNPLGEDPHREVVVLGNTTSSSINLNAWGLLDRHNNRDTLPDLVIPAGESRLIRLSGNGVQLGNAGGTIRLVNAAGDQIHAVTYSQEDTKTPGRYIRFK